LSAGLHTNAVVLTEEMVRTWANAAQSRGVIWPTNQVSQWLLKRFVARTADESLVMGLVYPATNHVDATALTALSTELAQAHALLSGWNCLAARPGAGAIQNVGADHTDGGTGAALALVCVSPADGNSAGAGVCVF